MVSGFPECFLEQFFRSSKKPPHPLSPSEETTVKGGESICHLACVSVTLGQCLFLLLNLHPLPRLVSTQLPLGKSAGRSYLSSQRGSYVVS